jgi:hypothetical protein
MVPIGKNKSEDVGSVDSKRPVPYSLPQKPNWISLLNSDQNVSQKILRPSELRVTNNSQQQFRMQEATSPATSESPVTPVKAFPIPLPRMNSSSSNDSMPKTPIPLPRTKFNLPAIEATSLVLERSASFPDERAHPVKPQLSYSVSDPTSSNRPQLKIDNKTVDSTLSTVLESSTKIDSTSLVEEDDGDTWL